MLTELCWYCNAFPRKDLGKHTSLIVNTSIYLSSTVNILPGTKSMQYCPLLQSCWCVGNGLNINNKGMGKWEGEKVTLLGGKRVSSTVSNSIRQLQPTWWRLQSDGKSNYMYSRWSTELQTEELTRNYSPTTIGHHYHCILPQALCRPTYVQWGSAAGLLCIIKLFVQLIIIIYYVRTWRKPSEYQVVMVVGQ